MNGNELKAIISPVDITVAYCPGFSIKKVIKNKNILSDEVDPLPDKNLIDLNLIWIVCRKHKSIPR